MEISVIEKKIEDLLAKKSLKKRDKESLASLLWDEYCQTNDIQQLSLNILKLPSNTRPIFQKIADGINRISIKDLVNSIKNDALFLKNKNDKSFSIACTFYYLFYKHEAYKECIYELFTKALMIADRNKEFSISCLKYFNEIIMADEKCKGNFFNVSWERPDKVRIYKFIKNLECKNYIDLTAPNMKKWIDDNQFEKPDRLIVIDETLKKCKEIIKDENTLQFIMQIQNNINELKKEIGEQNKKTSDLYHSLDNCERENAQLRNSLSRKESECSSLTDDAKIKSEKIALQEKKVLDLESELGKFSQTANDTKADEIFTLKNDIYLALKNEYEKYIADKESDYTEDLFEAYKSRFFRIFTTLKRFGIIFEEGK